MPVRENTTFAQPLAPPEKAAPWYLLDLALRTEGLKELYTRDPSPSYQLLYHGTSYDHLSKQGPLLVHARSSALQEEYQRLVSEGQAIALYGEGLNHDALKTHFETLLRVAMEGGGKALFRFADPRTCEALGESLTPGQCHRLLGRIERMVGAVAGKFWQLARTEAPFAAADEPLYLTRDNLDNIGRWRRQALVESLAEEEQVSSESVARWFEQLQDLKAGSERALYEGARRIARSGRTTPLTEDQLQRVRMENATDDDLLQQLDQVLAYSERMESA